MDAGLVSFKVGDKVRVQEDIGSPSYHWGDIRPGDIGVVVELRTEEHMIVDFPSQSGWNAHPLDMELVNDLAITTEVAQSGSLAEEILTHIEEAAKAKRKSPDKVLGYGIIQKDGSLHSATQDREVARKRKASLGGKQEGVTIVVLKAGKEVR